MSLLAKSCLCPGLITVICNLITSSGEPPEKEELQADWLYEYWKGQGFEIYKTQLPVYFYKKPFSQVVMTIYRKFGAILFGIEIVEGEDSQIFLNPGNFIIPDNLDKVLGYIISPDKGVADEISNYKNALNLIQR